MSRQNKVNPGMYTQRGRLTQDDAARELKRQRTIGSEHSWPSKKDRFPRLASTNDDAALGAETSGDNESEVTTPSAVNAKPAPRVTRAATSKKGSPAKAKRKAKAAKPAANRAATKTVRKAVLARNVGGGGPRPRKTAKRRKS